MEAIAPTNPVRWSHRPTPRLGRNATKSPSECPPESVADAFLSQPIEPLLSLDKHNRFANAKETEADFFASLGHLETLYNFRVEDSIRRNPFPQNVALAFLEAKRVIKSHHAEMQLDIYDLTTNGGKSSACLVTYFEYDKPSSDSYWLAVFPLAARRGRKEEEPRANLLRSIMSYLDEVAGVPWYNDGDSFIYYQHDYFSEEWDQYEAGSEEEAEAKLRIDQVKEARQRGNKTRKWWQGQFRHILRRIEQFVSQSELDDKLMEIAQAIVKLSQSYPGRSIYQSYGDTELLRKEDDDYMIELWHYLTFNWDNEDYISEMAFNSLNEEWGNTGSHANPTKAQYFYEPQARIEIDNDFSYEAAFFDLVDDLSIYLNRLKRMDPYLINILTDGQDQQPI